MLRLGSLNVYLVFSFHLPCGKRDIRNSAGKAFSDVKALMSALVVVNEGKLISTAKDREEKDWIKKKAHIVPTIPFML
ncbi:MAG: PaREP1 family protein [Conexivisphaerales archaeon]|jgi:hypothetical protein